MQTFSHYTFDVSPAQPGVEILMAELSALNFEAFEERDNQLHAYVDENSKPANLEARVQLFQQSDFDIEYSVDKVDPVNWNAEWERNFQPIKIANCQVRASFHPEKDVDYDIVIDPKMAFGTGHHETTHLMLSYLLQEDVSDQNVLDMGCGTGVLAILAEMKKAAKIDAIDIDEWAVDNTEKNCKLNDCQKVNVFHGDAEELKDQEYDFIFANINRNILLADMSKYASVLTNNGVLFVSGFYEKDLISIQNEAEFQGLKLIDAASTDDWTAAKICRQ